MERILEKIKEKDSENYETNVRSLATKTVDVQGLAMEIGLTKEDFDVFSNTSWETGKWYSKFCNIKS